MARRFFHLGKNDAFLSDVVPDLCSLISIWLRNFSTKILICVVVLLIFINVVKYPKRLLFSVLYKL
ncbi:hypothetical Protein YC6258_01903 [Gynuella sunshinyii YC6258]|uniref:Uncharacterized protein n=1 Tax=Gynuella sunshinyii YC6258 TaxID=1445510 RepID=A0A0C5VKL6_9GAMM|nr:hypothetical Protein YC6258_01903 [Gynuella sunshinyii YC6258]